MDTCYVSAGSLSTNYLNFSRSFPRPRSHGVCWRMAEQVGRSISSCCISCEKRTVRATVPCTFPARGGPWRALVAELWSKEGWMPSSWLVRWAFILVCLYIWFLHKNSFIYLFIYLLSHTYTYIHIHIYIYIVPAYSHSPLVSHLHMSAFRWTLGPWPVAMTRTVSSKATKLVALYQTSSVIESLLAVTSS